jgi:hypothetical protein
VSVDRSGQIGGIGASECSTDLDCEPPILDLKERFETGGRYHHKFDSSACVLAGVTADESAEGPACECRINGSEGTLTVGPVGLSCFAWGNFGQCILPGNTFRGCEVGADPICDDHCQTLEAALAAQANETYDVEIRLTECRENGCVSVIRLEEQCIVNEDLTQKTTRDCSLSNEDLIADYESGIPRKSAK